MFSVSMENVYMHLDIDPQHLIGTVEPTEESPLCTKNHRN